MAKKIKLKQEDIENIVKKIVNEQMNSFDEEENFDLNDANQDDELSGIYVEKEISNAAEEFAFNDEDIVNPLGPDKPIMVKNPDTQKVYIINNRTGDIYEEI